MQEKLEHISERSCLVSYNSGYAVLSDGTFETITAEFFVVCKLSGIHHYVITNYTALSQELFLHSNNELRPPKYHLSDGSYRVVIGKNKDNYSEIYFLDWIQYSKLLNFIEENQ